MEPEEEHEHDCDDLNCTCIYNHDDYIEPDYDNYDPIYDYKYYDGTG